MMEVNAMVLNYKRSDLKIKEHVSTVKEGTTSKMSEKKQHEINKLIARLLIQNDQQ